MFKPSRSEQPRLRGNFGYVGGSTARSLSGNGLTLTAKDGEVVDLAPNTAIFWEDDETTVVIWGGFQDFLMPLCRCLRCSYTR